MVYKSKRNKERIDGTGAMVLIPRLNRLTGRTRITHELIDSDAVMYRRVAEYLARQGREEEGLEGKEDSMVACAMHWMQEAGINEGGEPLAAYARRFVDSLYDFGAEEEAKREREAEAPYADRALNDVPDAMDFDDLYNALHSSGADGLMLLGGREVAL